MAAPGLTNGACGLSPLPQSIKPVNTLWAGVPGLGAPEADPWATSPELVIVSLAASVIPVTLSKSGPALPGAPLAVPNTFQAVVYWPVPGPA